LKPFLSNPEMESCFFSCILTKWRCFNLTAKPDQRFIFSHVVYCILEFWPISLIILCQI